MIRGEAVPRVPHPGIIMTIVLEAKDPLATPTLQTPTVMLFLPPELLECILDSCTDESLKSLCLVNRTLAAIVRPRIFRSIDLHSPIIVARFVDLLSTQDPAIARMVRKIHLKGSAIEELALAEVTSCDSAFSSPEGRWLTSLAVIPQTLAVLANQVHSALLSILIAPVPPVTLKSEWGGPQCAVRPISDLEEIFIATMDTLPNLRFLSLTNEDHHGRPSGVCWHQLSKRMQGAIEKRLTSIPARLQLADSIPDNLQSSSSIIHLDLYPVNPCKLLYLDFESSFPDLISLRIVFPSRQRVIAPMYSSACQRPLAVNHKMRKLELSLGDTRDVTWMWSKTLLASCSPYLEHLTLVPSLADMYENNELAFLQVDYASFKETFPRLRSLRIRPPSRLINTERYFHWLRCLLRYIYGPQMKELPVFSADDVKRTKDRFNELESLIFPTSLNSTPLQYWD